MNFDFASLLIAQTDNPGAKTTIQTPGGEDSGTVAPPNGGSPPTAAPTSPLNWVIFLPVIAVMVFLLWTSSSAQRKERKQREAMLSALKRHDRVQTIGGLIGSVVEMKDNEVVLKVDEANNVKMRFAKSAVQQVLSEGAGDETSGK